MVGVRVIEADDVVSALAPFTLDADEFLGIDVVAVVSGIGAGVSSTDSRCHDAVAIVIEAAEQYSAAFVRISFFAVAAETSVVFACYL